MKKRYLLAALGLSLLLLAGCSKEKTEEIPEEATEELEVAQIDLEPSEYVKLGQYKGLTVETSANKEITDEMIDEQIEMYSKDIVEYEPLEGRDTVEAGDILNLDIKVMVDGEEDETYRGEDIHFILGDEFSDWIMAVDIDYENALIGKKVGDTAKIKFTFPEDYEYDNYAGFDAELIMKINAIEKTKELEINDAWAKEYMGVKDMAELRKVIKKQLEEDQEMNAEYEGMMELWKAIIANCTQIKEFPEDRIRQDVDGQRFMMDDYLQMDNMTEEEYCKQFMDGLSVEDYVKRNIMIECAQKLIVDEEGLAVTHADVTKELEPYVDGQEFGTIDEVIESMGGEESVKKELLQQRVEEFLKKENTIK